MTAFFLMANSGTQMNGYRACVKAHREFNEKLLTFPYHTADISWLMDTDVDPFFTAMVPTMNLQDTVGDFTDLMRVRFSVVNSAKVGFRDYPAGKFKITSLSILADFRQYSFNAASAAGLDLLLFRAGK